ncbi:MAG: VTC domain-containing protein [Planctomycetota bacterium]|jgi:hypothetical protein
MIRKTNRYELKYVTSVFRAKRFLEDVAPYVRPDPYAGPSGVYRVVSLYYDTPQLHFYRAKREGLKARRKLRLRVYPNGDLGAVRHGMVEIKQRYNQTVQKRRMRLDLATAEDLCAGNFDPSDLGPDEQDLAWEVRAMVSTMQLRPSCVVSYLRQPLEGSRYDPGLRITVDSGLMARIHGLEVAGAARNHLFLDPSYCIVEVKANDRIPRWLASLVASHRLVLRRMGKYCLGVEKTHGIRIRENVLGAST